MQLDYQSLSADQPIRFVRWAGFGVIGGLFSTAIGVWIAIMGACLLNAPDAGGFILPGLFLLVIGGLLAVGGVVRALGVSGSRIDRARGTLKVWRGLIVPLSGRTYPLAAFAMVRVGTAIEGGGRYKTLVYPVSLIGIANTVQFHVATNYVAARRTAIRIAQALGYPLRDDTGTSPVIRTSETLGVPLRDRESAPFARPASAASRTVQQSPPPLPHNAGRDHPGEGTPQPTTAAPAIELRPAPHSRLRATRTPDGVTVEVARPSFRDVAQFPSLLISLLAGLGVLFSVLMLCFSEKPVSAAELVGVPAAFATLGILLSLPFVLPVVFVSTMLDAGRPGLRIRRRGLLTRSRREIPAAAIDEIRVQYGCLQVITPQEVVGILAESLDVSDLEWVMQTVKQGLCA